MFATVWYRCRDYSVHWCSTITAEYIVLVAGLWRQCWLVVEMDDDNDTDSGNDDSVGYDCPVVCWWRCMKRLTVDWPLAELVPLKSPLPLWRLIALIWPMLLSVTLAVWQWCSILSIWNTALHLSTSNGPNRKAKQELFFAHQTLWLTSSDAVDTLLRSGDDVVSQSVVVSGSVVGTRDFGRNFHICHTPVSIKAKSQQHRIPKTKSSNFNFIFQN